MEVGTQKPGLDCLHALKKWWWGDIKKHFTECKHWMQKQGAKGTKAGHEGRMQREQRQGAKAR